MEKYIFVIGLRLDHGCGWDADELILVLFGGGCGVGRSSHCWWRRSRGSVGHCRYW